MKLSFELNLDGCNIEIGTEPASWGSSYNESFISINGIKHELSEKDIKCMIKALEQTLLAVE